MEEGRDGRKEVNGVVFLSYSVPERGERWGPGGTSWVVSMIGELCVLIAVCACKKVRKRKEFCMLSIQLWEQSKASHISLKAV